MIRVACDKMQHNGMDGALLLFICTRAATTFAHALTLHECIHTLEPLDTACHMRMPTHNPLMSASGVCPPSPDTMPSSMCPAVVLILHIARTLGRIIMPQPLLFAACNCVTISVTHRNPSKLRAYVPVAFIGDLVTCATLYENLSQFAWKKKWFWTSERVIVNLKHNMLSTEMKSIHVIGTSLSFSAPNIANDKDAVTVMFGFGTFFVFFCGARFFLFLLYLEAIWYNRCRIKKAHKLRMRLLKYDCKTNLVARLARAAVFVIKLTTFLDLKPIWITWNGKSTDIYHQRIKTSRFTSLYS